MLDLPENELFSAYIDGELTADEQAEVEQILTDNPEALQLVDELRSLSRSLQSLPAYRLDEDLAARVLRQAEQEMLSQPATPLPKFHHVDVPQAKSTSWARRLLRPRNFAWSALAIVVAVALMLNEADTGNGNSNNVAKVPGGGVIESSDVIEAQEAPSIPTFAQAPDSIEPEGDNVLDPEVVAPAPAMIAETPTKAAPESIQQVAAPKEEPDPLLILQCQLAEGRIGHESLAELLEQAGVTLANPIAEDGGPVEFTLTSNQVRKVVSLLKADNEHFTDFVSPRIPSAVGPGGSHPEPTAAADGNEPKEPPEASFDVQGTIPLQAKKAGPHAKPAESTAVDDDTPEADVTAKATPSKAVDSLPVKDDCTYRVRFVLKTAKKAPKKKAPTDK